MTEDEAKTKWCPFARTLEYDHADQMREQPVSASVNRVPGVYDKDGNETVEISGRHRCIASACMAWRRAQNAPTPQKVKAYDRGNWESAGWFTDGVSDANGQITMRMVHADDGFCGLAGTSQ